jgi:NAD(P)-dependent dehydrogenase (short-subunit alcohol dehydrogenase family)
MKLPTLPLPVRGRRRDAQGLRVLITGASGTIGRELGRRLAEQGAQVVGLDLHRTEGAA